MISSASDTGTRGACADTGTAGSGAGCSGTPSGRNADSFSADAHTGINSKGNCREHQRRADNNDGCKSQHDFSSFPFLFISIRAAPWPKDTRPEQAHSRD